MLSYPLLFPQTHPPLRPGLPHLRRGPPVSFHPFSFVGSAISGGGGGRHLFMLPDDASLCLGSISGEKACIKVCLGD